MAELDRKMRIGIIGCGGIANSHAKAYKNMPDVEIVALCDIAPGRAAAFAAKHGFENAKTEYKDDFKDTEEVARLKKEATNTASSVAQDIDVDDDDEGSSVDITAENEEIYNTVSSTDMGTMPRNVVTVTKFTVTDDSYLEKLLADLDDDWDNI